MDEGEAARPQNIFVQEPHFPAVLQVLPQLVLRVDTHLDHLAALTAAHVQEDGA